MTTSWGYPYGYSYANPYYVQSTVATPVYNYSQPIIINDYDTVPAVPTDAPEPETPEAPPPPPEESAEISQAYSMADKARDSFRTGNYTAASAQIQQAIAVVPSDPVLHEFSALCMFAMKDYQPAAGMLNNLMAVAPGMDWTTMSSLYPSVDVYETQLSDLDSFCQSHPQDAAAHFVLAYHRLVCGDADAAVKALQVVVKQQPKDQVAQRMLQSLSGDQTPADSPASSPAAASSQPEAIAADSTGPTTDLIGPWQAKRDDATFDLKLEEDGSFEWRSAVKGQDPILLAGTYSLANDLLVLDSSEQGAMVGRANPKDADGFSFVPVDSPPSDPGLSFGRVKN